MGARCVRTSHLHDEEVLQGTTGENEDSEPEEGEKSFDPKREEDAVYSAGAWQARPSAELCLGCRMHCTKPVGSACPRQLCARQVDGSAATSEFDPASRRRSRPFDARCPSAVSTQQASSSRTSQHHSDPNNEVDVVIMLGAPVQDAPSPAATDLLRRAPPRPWVPPSPKPMLQPPGLVELSQVMLNIYDIGTAPPIQMVNTCLQSCSMGLFHCGVEVHDTEWSFAATRSGAGSGVFWSWPRQCEMHSFRESVALGKTKFSERGVEQLIQVLQVAWPAAHYDILRRNCCHFCGELCQRLGVGPLPSRVLNLADASACMVLKC